MKLLLLAALCFPLILSARIGETPAQCSARYGAPINEHPSGVMVGYKKAGLFIICNFFEGKCAAVSYMKEERDALGGATPFSEVEIKTLREANDPGAAWKDVFNVSIDQKAWQSEKVFVVYNTLEPMLKILTKEQQARDVAAKAAKEKANLKGL